MRFLKLQLAALLLSVSPAWADLVSMNIGEVSGKKVPVKWVGTLTEIDAESDIAKFYYEAAGSEGSFEVHVTRIYSIIFKPFEAMSKDYPENNSHRDISSAVPYKKSRDRSRGILLDNTANQAADLIPENAVAQPVDRQGPDLKVYGIISHLDQESAILIISKRGGGKISVTVDSNLLLSWVRG